MRAKLQGFGWGGLALLATACGAGGAVGHDGEYTFLPDSDVSDSSAYPLRHLLVVEEDALAQKTLIYLFSGDLASADVGLKDLRRIALGYRMPQARFDYPKLTFATWTPEASSGEETAPPRTDAVSLSTAGGASIPLWTLDDDALRSTGASEFLATVSDARFAVRAYFGVLDFARLVSDVSITGPDFHLSHAPRLQSVALELTRDASVSALRLVRDEQPEPDYVIVDLLQTITRIEDQTRFEAMVRTSMPPTAPYAASDALVADMFSIGCWSAERPLTARLIQVARHYTASPTGDWAVIHRKADAVAVEPDVWAGALGTRAAASYCSDYE